MVLGLTLIIMQLNIRSTYEQQSVKKYIQEESFVLTIPYSYSTDGDKSCNSDNSSDTSSNRNLYNVDDIDSNSNQDIPAWLNFNFFSTYEITVVFFWEQSVLIPIVYAHNFTIMRQNYIFGDAPIRLLVRQYKAKTNNDPNTNSIFEEYIPNEVFLVDQSMGNHVNKESITLWTGQVLNYTEPGTADSPFNAGGYVINYPETMMEALYSYYLWDSSLISNNW